MDSADSENEDHPKPSEDAILDSLFYACDESNVGSVAVSKLITYLRNAISNGTEEFEGNLDELSLILDPDGEDVQIEISKFQMGIKQWISDIRQRGGNVSTDEENFPSPIAVNCAGSPGPSDYQVGITTNASSESVEGLGGTSPRTEWDRTSELITTVEKLQNNNRRLSEQHNAMQSQMESTEEVNAQLSAELEVVRKELRSAHMLLEKNKEISQENVDLRQTVEEYREHTTDLKMNLAQLEKDRTAQETVLSDLKEKLLEVQSQFETLQEERQVLAQALADQKQLCSELEELQGSDEDSFSRSGHLASVIAELSNANEELKAEKVRLESAVTELQGQLNARWRQSTLPDRRLDISGASLSDSYLLASTPATRRFTLRQELQEQESFSSSSLPSPMVGRLSCNESADAEGMDLSAVSFNQSWQSSSMLNDSNISYTALANQVAADFRENKEKALRQIDELVALDNDPEIQERHNALRRLFAQDMDSFVEKIATLGHKKRIAEKRSARLLVAVKKLKDEHKLVMDERDKALQKLGNLSLCGDELGSRLDSVKEELGDEKEKAQAMAETIGNLEQQLVSVTQELLEAKEERDGLTKSLDSQVQNKAALEKQLEGIAKTQADLESQLLQSSERIKELESELERSASHLTLEKQRTSSLEESLQLSVARHSEELRDILDMIPSSESPSKTKLSPRASVTGHAVKAKLADYLTQSHATSNAHVKEIMRDSPDGQPLSEPEFVLNMSDSTSARDKSDSALPCEDQWRDAEINHHSSLASVLDANGTADSSPGRACSLVEIGGRLASVEGSPEALLSPGEKSRLTTAVQTDSCDVSTVSSQTVRLVWPSQDPLAAGEATVDYARLVGPSHSTREETNDVSLQTDVVRASEVASDSPVAGSCAVKESRTVDSQTDEADKDSWLSQKLGAFGDERVKESRTVDSQTDEAWPDNDSWRAQKLGAVGGENVKECRTVDSQTDEAWPDKDSWRSEKFGALEEHRVKESRTIGFQTDSEPLPTVCVVTEAESSPTDGEDVRADDTEGPRPEAGHAQAETSLRVERERSVTNLWRRKISAALKVPEEFELFDAGDSAVELEPPSNAKTFVNGVSLRVSPAPSEKEIEKQFKILVLAFRTDQYTLARRLQVQARSRDMAEANMYKELQNMDSFLREFEEICLTRETQDQLLKMKKHVEVLERSLKRLSTQAQQHGCVQQEFHMSTSIEVMISHAENLTRHLEILQEDLGELRKKEKLQVEEPVEPVFRTVINGPPSLGNSEHEDGLQDVDAGEDKQGAEYDGRRRGSLINFMLALHSTSVRAKDALQNFRKRTEASNARRKEQLAELDKLSEGSHRSANSDEDDVPHDDPGDPFDSESPASSHVETEEDREESCGAEDGENDDQVVSDENGNEAAEDIGLSKRKEKRSVCQTCCKATLYLAVSLAVCFIILAVTLIWFNHYTPSTFRLTGKILWSYLHEHLKPVERIWHYTRPPVE